jgi:membrane-associated protein
MTLELLNYLLTLVLVYGYPIIVVVVLLGELSIPMPVSALLLAAGSFSSDGTLNLFIIIVIATLGATGGDALGYYVGKKFGSAVLNKFKIRKDKLHSTEEILSKWGRWFIFVTRWLITPMGVPLNLIAGINRYPFKKFFIWTFLGELLWASIYTYLGYLFGENWTSLVDIVGNVSQVIMYAVLGFGILFIGLRLRKKYKN